MVTLSARVPGSTSNVGHGFDCMGAAVGLWNTVTAEVTDKAACLSDQAPGMLPLAEALRSALTPLWGPLPSLHLSISAEVPMSRGLGSSCTILVALAAIWQQLSQQRVVPAEFLPVCAQVEGHPDNVVASALGGFTLAAEVAGKLRWQHLSMPEDWQAVLTIPSKVSATDEARGHLPSQLSRDEAVRAWQRCALITAAIAQGDAAGLGEVFDQAWHEQHRASANPDLAGVRHRAAEHGAIGTWLSGSGSTMLSLCTRATATAVKEALRHQHDVRIVNFAATGVELI